MKRIITLFAFLLLISVSMSAQRRYRVSRTRRYKPVVVNTDSIAMAKMMQSYVDSLAAYKSKLDSVCHINDSLQNIPTLKQRQLNYKLFSPLTYYHDVTQNAFEGDQTDATDNEVDRILFNTYMTRPDLVKTTVAKLYASASKEQKAPVLPVQRKVNVEKEVKHQEEEMLPQTPVELYIYKPNFWTFSSDYSLQFMQNYLSDNWYQSGESNLNMAGNITLQANYNNKQKLKFENKLEMKLGFQTSESDTVHYMKTSSDLLRYTGKLGIQASKKWYYTFQTIATTQFAYGLKSNKTEIYSDFMSPFTLNLSLGMDYTVDTRSKKLSGSLHLAPIAYNLKYVGRLNLATRNGIDEGQHSKSDYGSEITINLTWKPNDNLKWQTRMYAYTTYKRMEYQWENTISYALSKYISTTLFLYPRFDDGVNRIDGESYWQFKEYFSLGFNYSM